MNLTTRRKFSHRLDALLDAVVEGKGLSQLKSLDEAEDVQLSGAQYQSQHSPESQDTGLEANGLMKVQDTSETYEKDDSDNEPLPSADFAVDNHSKPQDTETSISSDAVDGGVMGGANARLRPQEPGVSNGAAIELVDDEALQSKLSATASLQPSVNETQPKRQDQSVVDDGDFVDYDDEDDEHTHATSSGSSTLQGDSFDATADSDHSSSGLAKPIVEDQELKFPANDSENIAEKERNIPSREEDEFSAISAIVHKHPRGDIAREDLQDFEENEKFSQEASGDEEELQSHQDVETSSKTYPQYINIANHNGDGEPSQGEDEAGSYDCEVFQESAEQSFIPVGPATFNGDGEDHQAINYAGPKDRYSDAFQYEHLSITNDLGVGGELLEAHTTSFDNDDDNNNQHPAEGNLKVTVLAESFENSQDDEDEITYEDEDNNLESPVEPLNAGPVSASSPGSLKRARYPSHDDDDPEQVFQGT